MQADDDLVTNASENQSFSIEAKTVREWYGRARHKYVWDIKTFEPYFEVIAEVVQEIIKYRSGDSEVASSLISSEIGLISIVEQEYPSAIPWACALYVTHARFCPQEKATIFSQFKENYRLAVGSSDILGGLGNFLSNENYIRENFPNNADLLIEKVKSRSKLVKTFDSLAHKSLNHRRSIGTRLRYQVLQRDNSTCQVCGRRPPSVVVHIDHKLPVSWQFSSMT